MQITSPYLRRAAAALLVLIGPLGGCTRWVVQGAPVSEVLVEPRQPEEMVRITRKDGSAVILWGAGLLGDSVKGLRKTTEPVDGAVLHQRQRRMSYLETAVALSDIRAIALSERSALRTALFVSGAIGGMAAFGVAVSSGQIGY